MSEEEERERETTQLVANKFHGQNDGKRRRSGLALGFGCSKVPTENFSDQQSVRDFCCRNSESEKGAKRTIQATVGLPDKLNHIHATRSAYIYTASERASVVVPLAGHWQTAGTAAAAAAATENWPQTIAALPQTQRPLFGQAIAVARAVSAVPKFIQWNTHTHIFAGNTHTVGITHRD